MAFQNPGYLTYNHQYSETILLGENQIQPEAYRAVTRNGVYAAPLSYAAGVTYIERFGTRNLAFNGVGVDPAVSLPDLRNAIAYPPSGTAVLAGAILKNANTNTFYSVPAAVTLATGATLDARITADLASGAILEIPANAIANNLNASTTPYAPSVLGYQRIIPVVTDGIAIIELATVASAAAASITSVAALTVDQPLYVVDAAGRVGSPAAPASTAYAIGRCMDATAVPTSSVGFGVPAGYVRIKLGSI